MPWFRFRYNPTAEHRAWIAEGRIGEPPTVEYTMEFNTSAAAQAAAGELQDRLVSETGTAWVWVTEVEALAQNVRLPT